MGSTPSRETVEQLLPQAPFYGQRQQVVLIPLIAHFFPDPDCPLFRQLYETRRDPSVRYYQCVKEVFSSAATTATSTHEEKRKSRAAAATAGENALVMECEPHQCFPGTYFTREELYQAYIVNGPERFMYDTDAEMLSAYQADPTHAVRPLPCAVAFLYHFPTRPAQSSATRMDDVTAGKSVAESRDGGAAADSPGTSANTDAASPSAPNAEPWLSEGCVEVLGCYVKITGFVGDVSLLNPDATLRGGKEAPSPVESPITAMASAVTTSLPSSIKADEAEMHTANAPCMELHMYLTKSAGDHNRTHVLLSAMYTYAEQWQRACLHYAAVQEAREKAAQPEGTETHDRTASIDVTTSNASLSDSAPTLGVVPDRVRAHTTVVSSAAVFEVTRQYSSTSSSYYRKFLESKSATVMRSLLSATEAARESQKQQQQQRQQQQTTATEGLSPAKVTSHLSGTKRQRAAPDTAFLLWAAPPLPAVRLHSRRTNVPLLCFLREVRAAFMSMHICAENLKALQEVGEDSPLSDAITVAPATLTCNCVEYEAALDDLIMWLETIPTEVPRHPVDTVSSGAMEEAKDTLSASSAPTEMREETYLTVYAPSWVVQRLLEHIVDCLLHNLSPLEILKAQRELQHQHNVDPPPPEPTRQPTTTDPAEASEEGQPAPAEPASATPQEKEQQQQQPQPPPQRTVCHCAMLKRLGQKCIHKSDGPPCCCMSRNEDGTVSRVACRCSVNHSIGLETRQLRLPDEDIIVEEWPPRMPAGATTTTTNLSSPASAITPDLRELQTFHPNHRLLYLVGEDPARRQSATQCIVNWLAMGYPLTVGNSNANVEELEITVTLPTPSDDKTDQATAKTHEEGGESADKAAVGRCDCEDCDCEAGAPVMARGFTVHQLPRMAPLAPFLSTVAHPHPAVWSRRTLETFRQAAAEHERALRERAERNGTEASAAEPAPLLLLRPGTVIELARVLPTSDTRSDGQVGPIRDVRISCFPTEELLLAELRFASRKGREGHPDDAHWVRYGPGEGPPPSVPPQSTSESEALLRAARDPAEGEEEDDDEDAVPPRPPGGEDIVGDGSSCLWRMDLGVGSDRILAVTPYFLKPARKKHVKKKKAIPKAAAAHGTALNVFFYPLRTEETTDSETAATSTKCEDGAAEGTPTKVPPPPPTTTANVTPGVGGDGDEGVSGVEPTECDADGNPISTDKAKKKKKKKNKKKSATTAGEEGAGDSENINVADEEQPTTTTVAAAAAPAEAAPVEGTQTSAAESPVVATEKTKKKETATMPEPAVNTNTSTAPATEEPSPSLSPQIAPASAPTPTGTERAGSHLNSAATPFRSRQPLTGPEVVVLPSQTPLPLPAARVPLPRSRNTASATGQSARTSLSASYHDPQQAAWSHSLEGDGRHDALDGFPPRPASTPFLHPPPGAAPPGLDYYGGPLGYGMYPPGMPPPDPYFGGYDPHTGYPLPPPPPPVPAPHMSGGGGDFYSGAYTSPGAMMDGYGYYGNPHEGRPPAMIRPPQPRSQRMAGPPITPPVPRTRRQVSFDTSGEPIADGASDNATSGVNTHPRLPSSAAELLAESAAVSDAPPLLAQYNPAPLPRGLPPTSPTCAAPVDSALFSPSASAVLSDVNAHATSQPHHHQSSGDIHVSVKVRHPNHTRTVSYLSETTTATTDLAAGSGVLHFSASHADLEDSPHGTNHSLPVQSPTASMTHRRHASFSQYTAASSSEPLGYYGGGGGGGSLHHASLTGPPHQQQQQAHSQPYHSAASNASGRGAAAAGAGISGQAGFGPGSVKSGDTTSTTNTAKRLQSSSHTYRWDWRNVTLDIGDEDQ